MERDLCIGYLQQYLDEGVITVEDIGPPHMIEEVNKVREEMGMSKTEWELQYYFNKLKRVVG
jgi:hypothetical protein